MKTAEGHFRSGGRRLTIQRRAILQVLATLGCAQDAEAIHRSARAVYPRLGRVTVYRTLEILVAEGLVDQVILGGGRIRYELTAQGRHHHHLVCLSCGRIDPLECPVGAVDGTVVGRGFQVVDHRLEMFGYCARCGRRGAGRSRRA